MAETYRFGVFEFDPNKREIRRKGIRIRLQQQPYEILRLLVEYRGELVARELIQKTLWPEDHFVDFERSINTAVMRLRHALRDDAASPTYIETIARAGYRLIPPVVLNEEAASAESIRAIALLPLQDLANSPGSDSFVNGLTDALVTELAIASSLRVVSRSNAQRYKGSTLSARQIARELDVQALVEGSVLHVGDRIRISVRMLDPVRDKHLWAQTYDREMKELLVLQHEIVQAIARATTATLRHGAESEKPRQINPKAYAFYLRGNFMVSSRVAGQLQGAVECYENAMSLEPEWAPPCAMLAECCRLQAFYDYSLSDPMLDRAHSLIEKALALDPNNAQANATAGMLLALHDWHWNAGLDKIRLAQRADPRSAHIQCMNTQLMLHLGRFDDALRHVDAALSIDPSSMMLWSSRAIVLFVARRYDECLHESERLLEQNPSFPLSIMSHALALSEQWRLRESLGEFNRLIGNKGWSMAIAGRIQTLRRMKDHEAVQSDLEELERRFALHACSPSVLAWAYLAAGQPQLALAYMEKAFARHDSRLPLFMRLSPFDAIRDDEQFVQIRRQMNLDA